MGSGASLPTWEVPTASEVGEGIKRGFEGTMESDIIGIKGLSGEDLALTLGGMAVGGPTGALIGAGISSTRKQMKEANRASGKQKQEAIEEASARSAALAEQELKRKKQEEMGSLRNRQLALMGAGKGRAGTILTGSAGATGLGDSSGKTLLGS